MELKIDVKTEERIIDGQKRTVYIADCEGVKYEFDPLAQALKDCNADKLTDENLAVIEKKALEYKKIARQRVETGARVKWFCQKAEGLNADEINSLWASVWKYPQ